MSLDYCYNLYDARHRLITGHISQRLRRVQFPKSHVVHDAVRKVQNLRNLQFYETWLDVCKICRNNTYAPTHELNCRLYAIKDNTGRNWYCLTARFYLVVRRDGIRITEIGSGNMLPEHLIRNAVRRDLDKFTSIRNSQINITQCTHQFIEWITLL